MTKKLRVIALSLALCLSFTACGAAEAGGPAGSGENGTVSLSNSMSLLKEDFPEWRIGTFTFLTADGKTKEYTGYSSMTDFVNGVAVASRYNSEEEREFALITPAEKTVIDWGVYSDIKIYPYDGGFTHGDDLLLVEQNELLGIALTSGTEIIPCKYTDIKRFDQQNVGMEKAVAFFECRTETSLEVYNQTGVLLYSGAAEETLSHTIRALGSGDERYLAIYKEDDTVLLVNYSSGEAIYSTDKQHLQNLEASALVLTDSHSSDPEEKILCFNSEGGIAKEIQNNNNYRVTVTQLGNDFFVLEQHSRSSDLKHKFTLFDANWNEVYSTGNTLLGYFNREGKAVILEVSKDPLGVTVMNSALEELQSFPGYEPDDYNMWLSRELFSLEMEAEDGPSKKILLDYSGKVILEVENGLVELYSSFVFEQHPAVVVETVSAPGNWSDLQAVQIVDQFTQKVLPVETNYFVSGAHGLCLTTDTLWVLKDAEGAYLVLDKNTGETVFTVAAEQEGYLYRTDDRVIPYFELADGYYTLQGKKVGEL